MKVRNMSNIKTTYSIGAVSLFIVVFSALLMTVVTVSFVTLMIANEQHATANDLSQSALDSAQAGVEDAKRALLEYEAQCDGSTSGACGPIVAAMANCNGIFGALNVVGTSNSSVVAVGGSSDASYDQEYTCVEVALNTDNYLGTLNADQSVIIPLTSTAPFDTVQLSWYSPTDLQGAAGSQVNLASAGSGLYSQANWPVNRPSIMRVQMMQFDSSDGFTLSQFDSNSSGQSDAATMFLYPTGITGQSGSNAGQILFYTPRNIASGSTGNLPTDVTCNGDLVNGGFSCSVQLVLPAPVGGGTALSYLRLTSLYNASHYEVKLLSAGNTVDFQAVQPEIDSTGRANDVYRRVVTRVVLSDQAFPYPNAAVDTSGNFCKNFVVTDKTPDTDECTP
jgi:Tfp pilus assembly protein PilX